MGLGKQHTIIYPQDKPYNYQFPANNGLLASENYVNESIINALDAYVPTKELIDRATGQTTTYIKLATTLVSTNSTFKDVTDLAFDVIAGKTYDIDFIGFYRSNLATMGCRVGVRLLSGSGSIVGFLAGAVSSGAVSTELKAPIRFISSDANQAGASLITTAVSAINIDHYIEGKLSFKCLTSGRLSFTFGNERTGTANVSLMEGTQLKVTQY